MAQIRLEKLYCREMIAVLFESPYGFVKLLLARIQLVRGPGRPCAHGLRSRRGLPEARRAGAGGRLDREERARPAAGGHRLHARGPRRPVRGAALGRARGGRAGRPPARGGAPLRPRDRARRRPAGARRPRSAVADAARVRRRLGGGGRPRAIAGGDDRPIEGRRERLDPGGRGRVGGVVALEKRQRHGLDRRGMGPSAAHRPRRAPRRSLRRVHAPGRPARRPVPIR